MIATEVDIDVTDSTQIHLAIEELDGAQDRVRYIGLDWSGQIVHDATLSSSSDVGVAKSPCVAVSAGLVLVHWCDQDPILGMGLWQAWIWGSSPFGTYKLVGGSGIALPDHCRPASSSNWLVYQQEIAGVDRVVQMSSSGSPVVLDPGPGPARRPRIAAAIDQPARAVWEDRSSGNCRIRGAEWSADGTLLITDLPISASPADASAPDVDENADGICCFVWQDARHGGSELYCAWRGLRGIRVTAQVRPRYATDAFLDPPPPLPGVTVVLHREGGGTLTSFTDRSGMASFPAASADGDSFELFLQGPLYRIVADAVDDAQDQDPVSIVVEPVVGESVTEFTWPSSEALYGAASLQAAYFVQKFRLEYWLDRLEYEWNLRSRRTGEDCEDFIGCVLMESNPYWQQFGGSFAEPGGLTTKYLQGLAQADLAVYHELGHCMVADVAHAILGRTQIMSDDDDREGAAMDEAFADYFATSFVGEPMVATCDVDREDCQPLRNLAEQLLYATCVFPEDHYTGSRILSGALWDLRDAIDGVGVPSAPATDGLVLASLHRMLRAGPGASGRFEMQDFCNALIAEDRSHGGVHALDIELALQMHNLGPTQSSHCPLGWAAEVVVLEVNEFLDRIGLVWRSLPHATYRIEVRLIDWFDGRRGLSDGYVTVAEGLTDTTFVYTGRDPHTEYEFRVVPVDTTGEPGFASPSVPVAAADPTDVPTGRATMGMDGAGRLLSAAPNPFNPLVCIAFEVAAAGRVLIEIADLRGRKVRTLIAGEYPAGRHDVTWDGRDDVGRALASGVYLVRGQGAGWGSVRKVALLR
ncbi:MAG: FlgD immunoglobulin-like domain containing protein [Candidatus Krumholzibacteriia bacterium]